MPQQFQRAALRSNFMLCITINQESRRLALADMLNAKIGPIADNLTKFTGSGLGNVEALVDDTRRTMQTLNNAISRFDNDPQRLLFGGQDVKEFDGRVRR